VADEKVALLAEKSRLDAAEETYDVFDPSEYTPVDDEDESGRCPCGDPSCEYNN
jgi:hypothetical protein